MNQIVNIQKMYKSFYGVIALDGMNFSMNAGEVRCLIGENGCGKSTMIKVISGFYEFDDGSLEINQKPYAKLHPTESMKEGIQVIYQDFSLFPNMTVAENIMMYHTVFEGKPLVNQRVIRQKAIEILQKIKMNIDPDLYVSQLNVAQKQMVAICRAIVNNAKLLVMDEPTTALTTNEVKRLFEVVRGLRSQGVAILFVSHKLDEILEICDSITIMRNGRNVYDNKVGEEKLSKDDLIFYMTGKRLTNTMYEYIKMDDQPLLEVQNLALKGVFSDINFSLYRGEVLGITGLLGCGRSELAETLFGIWKATDGKLKVYGKDVGVFKNVQQALAQNIAYVPEDRLTEGLHLEQNIAKNSVARVIGSFVKKNGLLDNKAVQAQISKGLSSMEVAGMRPENPAKSLSGGNQQKIVLIKWLASNPDILILNCPTVGVDVGAKSDIHAIVQDMAKTGKSVILISDDILEIMQTCNRVLIMKEGHFCYETNIQDTTMEQLSEILASDDENGATK